MRHAHAHVLRIYTHIAAYQIIKLVDNFDAGYDYITNEGNVFYFKTNKDAPRYKLVTVIVDILAPGGTHAPTHTHTHTHIPS